MLKETWRDRQLLRREEPDINSPENWKDDLLTIWNDELGVAIDRTEFATSFLRIEILSKYDLTMISECMRHDLTIIKIKSTKHFNDIKKNEYIARVTDFSHDNLRDISAIMLINSGIDFPSLKKVEDYMDAAMRSAETIDYVYEARKKNYFEASNFLWTIPGHVHMMRLVAEEI